MYLSQSQLVPTYTLNGLGSNQSLNSERPKTLPESRHDPFEDTNQPKLYVNSDRTAQ